MSYGNIRFQAENDGVALVTVNRPDKLNALNRDTMGELADAFSRVRDDAAIRGLIVTGAGERAFVAGADIKELAVLSPVEAQALSLRGQAIFRTLETMAKPSVAAINGFALGGGLELAMSCTIRTAAPGAKFGQPEVKLGIVPGYGATQRLPRLVGRGRALDMLISGEMIDSAEAHRIGLVNYVVPHEELLAFSRAWLHKVLANGPHAVSLAMEAVDVGLDCSLDQGLRFEAAAFGLTAATEDRREGTSAFLEKRKPAFAGK
jgi:enoyl-CoA hydratase